MGANVSQPGRAPRGGSFDVYDLDNPGARRLFEQQNASKEAGISAREALQTKEGIAATENLMRIGRMLLARGKSHEIEKLQNGDSEETGNYDMHALNTLFLVHFPDAARELLRARLANKGSVNQTSNANSGFDFEDYRAQKLQNSVLAGEATGFEDLSDEEIARVFDPNMGKDPAEYLKYLEDEKFLDLDEDLGFGELAEIAVHLATSNQKVREIMDVALVDQDLVKRTNVAVELACYGPKVEKIIDGVFEEME